MNNRLEEIKLIYRDLLKNGWCLVSLDGFQYYYKIDYPSLIITLKDSLVYRYGIGKQLRRDNG